MSRTVEEEENEHHANRNLQRDPEAEDRKEQRVRERTQMYDEQGVGIANHQPAAAKSDTDESDDDAETDGEAKDAESEDADDEN